MPSYDYECENCKEEFEVSHSMSDICKLCPMCGSDKVTKLISGGAGVIIKGTTTPCRQTGQRPKKKLKKLGEDKHIPPWRDGPVNKDILKNPEKYIQTGEI